MNLNSQTNPILKHENKKLFNLKKNNDLNKIFEPPKLTRQTHD